MRLCFNESVRSRVGVTANLFANELALQWISSLMTLYSSESVRWWVCVTSFSDELIREQRISSLTSLCFSKLVPSRVCASANPFPHEYVLQRISSLRVCIAANQFADDSIFQQNSFTDQVKVKRISSLMSLCCSELVCTKFALQQMSSLMTLHFSGISSLMRLCGVVNQFVDEHLHHRISLLTSPCFNESVSWRVCDSPI
jgi:hypothetical protein